MELKLEKTKYCPSIFSRIVMSVLMIFVYMVGISVIIDNNNDNEGIIFISSTIFNYLFFLYQIQTAL